MAYISSGAVLSIVFCGGIEHGRGWLGLIGHRITQNGTEIKNGGFVCEGLWGQWQKDRIGHRNHRKTEKV